MTKLQHEYAKQEKRIKSLLRRAEKRGYIIPDNIMPEKPKRITRKSIERLQYLKPERLYAKMEYVIHQTGEVISGTKGRELERQSAALKGMKSKKKRLNTLKKLYNEYGLDEKDLTGKYTPTEEPERYVIHDIGGENPDKGEFNLEDELGKVMYDNFVEGIMETLPSKLYEMVMWALYEVIEEVGRTAVGYALNEMPEEILDYFTGGVNAYKAVDRIKMDMVKRLPVKPHRKIELLKVFDEYTESTDL